MAIDFTKFNANINNEELNKQLTEAKNNTPTYKEVPAGKYTVKIEKMEIKEFMDSLRFSAQARILDGEFKKSCIFKSIKLTGTKNDGFMLYQLLNFLRSLESSVDVEDWSGDYGLVNDNILDILEDITDSLEYDVELSYNEYNGRNYANFEVLEVFDAE